MGVAIPTTNGSMAQGPLTMQSPTVGTPPPAIGAPSASAVQGTGDLTGMHNTPMHVAGILLVAGGALLFFRVSGFRFAFDVGLGRG
jgi:hypothetical protein